MLNCKKGEIGETITWVVATVIILVVLTIFIFASSVLAGFQSISVDSGEVSITYSSLGAKTDNAFDKNSDNRAKINEWIGITKSRADEIIDTQFIAGP